MAVKKNMNEQDIEPAIKRKWQVSLIVDNQKEAVLLADAEQLPRPDEYYCNYPAPINLPSLYTFFGALRKARKLSAMGIYSRVSKVG